MNANLLQRSEVVALINTLHRFSESLHAVEVFRRLWRESNTEESENLIREAEKAVNTPVSSAEEGSLSVSDVILAIPAISDDWRGSFANLQLCGSAPETSEALGPCLQGGCDRVCNSGERSSAAIIPPI